MPTRLEASKLDPQLLRVFLVVANSGTITAAAEQLFRTQPAVSAAIKRLEERFGEPLFERSASGVTLTHLGERLLPHARALERVMGEANGLADDARQLSGARLRIAASTTIALFWLPDKLAAFFTAYPDANLIVHTRNSEEAMTELASGEVDLALVEAPAGSWQAIVGDLVQGTKVYDDELALILHAGHQLAGARRLPLTALRGLQFVGRERGSGTRQVVESALEAAGITLDVRLELGEPTAIKLAVRAGIGAAILSRAAVRSEVAAGELVEVTLDSPRFARQFTLLHAPEELASRAAWAFRGLALADASGGPPTPAE